DEKRRAISAEADELKQTRNEKSKSIGLIIKEGGDANAAKEEVRQLGDRIKQLDEELRSVEADLNDKLSWLPNYPAPNIPVGGEQDYRVLRSWGEKPEQGFTPKTHKELGEALGILDFDRAAKLSGSGFSILLGKGAALQRGLI